MTPAEPLLDALCVGILDSNCRRRKSLQCHHGDLIMCFSRHIALGRGSSFIG